MRSEGGYCHVSTYKTTAAPSVLDPSPPLAPTPLPPSRLPSLLHLPVMPHENSPLLSKTNDCVEYGLPMKTETSIYDRFTPRRKRMILVLISLAGMIPREYPASALAMHRSPVWLTLYPARVFSICYWLFRAMYSSNLSRPTYDGNHHQASSFHHWLLLPCARDSKLTLGNFY